MISLLLLPQRISCSVFQRFTWLVESMHGLAYSYAMIGDWLTAGCKPGQIPAIISFDGSREMHALQHDVYVYVLRFVTPRKRLPWC